LKDWEYNLEKELRKILEKILENFMVTSEITPGETNFFEYRKIEITLPNGRKIIKEQKIPPTLNNLKTSTRKSVQAETEITPNFLSDVIRTPNEVIVIAELPTLDEKDINLEVKNGVVRIFCKGQLVHELEAGRDIDTSSIKKDFKNRILELRIPLKERSNQQN